VSTNSLIGVSHLVYPVQAEFGGNVYTFDSAESLARALRQYHAGDLGIKLEHSLWDKLGVKSQVALNKRGVSDIGDFLESTGYVMPFITGISPSDYFLIKQELPQTRIIWELLFPLVITCGNNRFEASTLAHTDDIIFDTYREGVPIKIQEGFKMYTRDDKYYCYVRKAIFGDSDSYIDRFLEHNNYIVPAIHHLGKRGFDSIRLVHPQVRYVRELSYPVKIKLEGSEETESIANYTALSERMVNLFLSNTPYKIIE